MLMKIHNDFQEMLDHILESDISIEAKIKSIQTHLLTHQDLYEEMMFSCFNKEDLPDDNYFYITYTYLDQPIDNTRPEEMVVSMLYDRENGFYFEISVLNYPRMGEEKVLTFNRTTSFLN